MVAYLCLAAILTSLNPLPKLNLKARSADARTGAQFAATIQDLPLEERENRIESEILNGNVPSFLRRFQPVPIEAEGHRGTIYVLPDYLAVGSDDDCLYVPTTPYTAQRLADKLHCLLPTPKMVDEIYAAATNKLTPSPIPPAPAMTTVPWFEQISRTIASQRQNLPAGALTAGDKKDIVICKALKDTPGHVAIYGWHKPDGKPIQPLYLGHIATWADYSHGIRLVSETMDLDGKPAKVADVLKDTATCELISGEGAVEQPRYVFHVFPHAPDTTVHVLPGERTTVFSPMKGVRVLIDEPTEMQAKVRLVLFALPNGNTIEQTMGRRMQPDDDWHYDIQHIAAQTRFVRAKQPDESLVVAYIEAANHAWPAWLRAGDPKSTLAIVDSIASRYPGARVTLDSHSGGGALELAYIASVDAIPDWIDRIAFLDSEYNYDTDTHEKKLADWLRKGGNYLCCIAYDDYSALLEGKHFVSEAGGTWGRTHQMLKDLGAEFPIDRVGHGDPERFCALDGRVEFLLKENPKHEIFHTVQVERNGFIESLLSGTPLEEKGYRYFGPRAYAPLIAP